MSHLLESKKQKITSVAKVVEKREALYTTGGNINWAVSMENSVGVPQKCKKRTTISSNNSILGYLSKENKNLKKKKKFSSILIAAKTWKQI